MVWLYVSYVVALSAWALVWRCVEGSTNAANFNAHWMVLSSSTVFFSLGTWRCFSNDDSDILKDSLDSKQTTRARLVAIGVGTATGVALVLGVIWNALGSIDNASVLLIRGALAWILGPGVALVMIGAVLSHLRISDENDAKPATPIEVESDTQTEQFVDENNSTG